MKFQKARILNIKNHHGRKTQKINNQNNQKFLHQVNILHNLSNNKKKKLIKLIIIFFFLIKIKINNKNIFNS